MFSGAAEAFLMFGIKNETHVKKTPKKSQREDLKLGIN